jgi:hypothetical protein
LACKKTSLEKDWSKPAGTGLSAAVSMFSGNVC